MHKILLFLSSILLLISCSSDSEPEVNPEETPELQEVTFSFSQTDRDDISSSDELNKETSSLKLVNDSNLEPFALIVSLINSNGDLILENQQLLLSSTDGLNFISESVSLEVGDYSVVTFNVINAENEIIFATPLEGSEMAEALGISLPIPFSIDTTESTTATIITPEVVLVLETDTPEQFGFASFSFNIIERENIFLSAKKTENEMESNIEADYTLTIQDSDYTLSGIIENEYINLILPKVPDDSEIYISVTYDDRTQNQTITGAQLSDYLASNPLTFYFLPKRLNVTPIPIFTYSSNEDYSIQTLINTTEYTNSVMWTLPASANLISGSLTDESIEVRFPNSGNYDISLKVFSEGYDADGNPNILESEAVNETFTIPIVTSITEITELPVIFRGSFEPSETTNPLDCINRDNVSCSVIGELRNDQAKEWWIADGISERVFLGDIISFGTTIADPNQELIDTGLESQTWFPIGDFNRISTTIFAWFGDRAASFDPTRPNRVAVQEIDVIPGVDYKITYFINNVLSVTGASLKVYILDSAVANDVEANLSENRIAGRLTSNDEGVYTEETLAFNAGNNTSVKLYFYPEEPTLTTFYLDDVSIAID